MKGSYWKYCTPVFVVVVIQKCCACENGKHDEDSGCWYTLWYIWFVLSLFVIVIAVLIVLYIKHRTKERNRHRRRRRSTRTIPIHIAPTQPPGYAEPSHKPPSYDEAISQVRPTGNVTQQIPGVTQQEYNDDYRYRPPPTRMRMANIATIPSSPQPLPPSYAESIQGQGQVTTPGQIYSLPGQGHPV